MRINGENRVMAVEICKSLLCEGMSKQEITKVCKEILPRSRTMYRDLWHILDIAQLEIDKAKSKKPTLRSTSQGGQECIQ